MQAVLATLALQKETQVVMTPNSVLHWNVIHLIAQTHEERAWLVTQTSEFVSFWCPFLAGLGEKMDAIQFQTNSIQEFDKLSFYV